MQKRVGRKPHELTGQRFGRLVATEFILAKPKSAWICKCDCGGEAIVTTAKLRAGLTRSCGCFQREDLGNRRRTHGMRRTPEYACWCHLKARCLNPRNPAYASYGGRGITVCDRWKDSFENFLADMGPKPHPNLTLDRINNDGPYSPDNCRWTSYAVQLNNRRPSVQRTRPVPPEFD